MNKILLITLLLTSCYSNASIIQDLKETPASKFDILTTNLEVAAVLLKSNFEQQYSDKKMPIQVHDVKAILTNELGVKISFLAPTKRLNDKSCSKLLANLSTPLIQTDALKGMVHDLTEKQYESLAEIFVLKLELVSEENTALKFPCN
ncbi:hypothetical protein SL034_004011 [Vibrio harveyi]|uniref:hypothetical protein n=1 Tax=Vibrio harveyi TaxID=669 RepID=UPI0004A2CFC4|nr:hypothetical protein [Vibrio harveyi]ELY1988940.1 hypothetical protein [Vibrio harveyi]